MQPPPAAAQSEEDPVEEEDPELLPELEDDLVSGQAELDASQACPSGRLLPGNGEDLVLDAPCSVSGGNYHYGNINIVNGGSLDFADSVIDFWAKSFLVENGGSMTAGSPGTPIGTRNGVITIRLYGVDQGPGGSGVLCKSDERCGAPQAIWDSNGASKVCLPPDPPGTNPSQCLVYDYFYKYHHLPVDTGDDHGYFGYKVLAVSYGGTLKLFGKKGATYTDLDATHSGTSWARLAVTVKPDDDTLVLDRVVDWERGDRIVLTTTDYLPGHSEILTVSRLMPDGKSVKIQGKVKYIHNGEKFPLSSIPDRLDIAQQAEGAETRAAVGLLTRSIRIVSAGETYDQTKKTCAYDCLPPASQLFPSTEKPGEQHPYYFGGHTVIRQGVKEFQVQGVEFFQMGQGGRLGHYPVHFHHTRKPPPETFVRDSSVYDSMTRFITIHATHDVELARNVGYLSIGHGYYLEEGAEINNKLYSNLGVMARAAVDNAQNPRKVPGILYAPAMTAPTPDMAYRSDVIHPSVFWTMNGWNEFIGNMAAGATSCGACYWPVLGSISGHSKNMTWESYASIQKGLDRSGTAPIKKFQDNYCSTAMNSFNTTPDSAVCHGVVDGSLRLTAIPNPLAPNPNGDKNNEAYYPVIAQTLPAYTRCDGSCSNAPTQACTADVDCGAGNTCTGDCSQVPKCSSANREHCMVTVLDRYTSSFHWAETNFSAIWLRPRWFLVLNSVLTDVQNAGLTFVTGGDYTHSSVIPGNWVLARKTVFIGHAQQAVGADQKVINPFVSDGGPFNPLKTDDGKLSGLSCENSDINYCLRVDEGIAMPLSNFGVNQRFFNIYDGPSLQDSNAYLNIKPTFIDDCPFPNVNQQCNNSKWMYGKALGVPGDPVKKIAYLPNAAIAWKQPNGFYYPPAFHSTNLFFENVDIRHFVIEPFFLETPDNPFGTDVDKTKARYATWNPGSWNGWTAIDRQTILNDDDGSLTGLKTTVSLNEDPFFNTPVETLECASDKTAKTSPYEHVTSVVYPACGVGCDPSTWNPNCTSGCYGVPLERQLLTGPENAAANPNTKIRMMGPAIAGRIQLTANHGKYYMVTTDGATQQASMPLKNIFEKNQTYYVFLVYARPTTKQTYEMFVGAGYDSSGGHSPGDFVQDKVRAVRVNLGTLNLSFDNQDWPGVWERTYNDSTGILTVTMDLSAFQTEFAQAAASACQPKPFCEWNSTDQSCDCSTILQQDDPELYTECTQKLGAEEHTICSWSVKDIDCPAFLDGTLKPRCLGFAVTLADSFVADGTDRRPTPECFPKDSDWDVPFTPVSEALAGHCANEPIPDSQFCTGLGSGGPPGNGGGGGAEEDPASGPNPPPGPSDGNSDGGSLPADGGDVRVGRFGCGLNGTKAAAPSYLIYLLLLIGLICRGAMFRARVVAAKRQRQ